jgi:hypothetical protein
MWQLVCRAFLLINIYPGNTKFYISNYNAINWGTDGSGD